MKKFGGILVLVLYWLYTPGFNAQAKNGIEHILLVYDYQGKGDQAFNDAAFLGKQKVEKELGIKIGELEARSVKSARRSINKKLKAGTKVVLFIGFNLTDLITELADKYPKKHFVSVDFGVDRENITSVLFKEQEVAFLAGYLAAKMSKTKKIGFIGGMPIPPVKRFESGYVQGASLANTKVLVSTKYLDSTYKNVTVWNNPKLAKKSARDLYGEDVDIIFATAGGSNIGVFNAAKETELFAIGVDINQNHIVPGRIFTSALKKVDTAVFTIVESYSKNTLSKGIKHLGLAEEGVGLAIDENTKKIVPKELLDEIQKLKEDIINGKITIK